MTSLADIVIVWPSDKEFVIAPIEQGLRAQGHRITRFHEIADAVKIGDGLLKDADIVMPFPAFPCTRSVMASAPRLRAALSPVTGIDGIDLKAATEQAIIVGNTIVPESHESMAEATILMMLACLYDLRGSEYILRNNLPSRKPVATMAKAKTLGIIGFGQISRAIATRLAGWDLQLQTFAPRLREPLPAHVKRVELEALLRTSDIVMVMASLNAETRNLLNADRLAMLKPGAIFINTARGEIVDEMALYRMAKDGRLRAIGVDVFQTEPLPADHPFRELSNATLTGHSIGHTVDTIAAMPRTAIENVTRALRGEPPLSVKNPDVLPAWQKRWRP
jgi:phosphoglycerate dehydrogenase-like enzyme